jgi:hypothetical protein
MAHQPVEHNVTVWRCYATASNQRKRQFLGNSLLSNTRNTENKSTATQWTSTTDVSAVTGIVNCVSLVTNSLRWNMNGEARCSVSGPTKSALRQSTEKAVRVEEAVSRRAASLQGVRTSKDRSDTRHQGVRIECNRMVVIPTRGVGNKRLWTIEWCSL